MTPGSTTRGLAAIGRQQKSQTQAQRHPALRLPDLAPLPGVQGPRGRGLGLKPSTHGQLKPSSSRRAAGQAATGAFLSSTSKALMLMFLLTVPPATSPDQTGES